MPAASGGSGAGSAIGRLKQTRNVRRLRTPTFSRILPCASRTSAPPVHSAQEVKFVWNFRVRREVASSIVAAIA